jgi:anti-sigma factor ChrR (cupin superfamily)
MISADHEALVLADVAGALDSDEREQLRASLEVLPPEERAHVAHLYDLGITLAEIAADAPPPPHLRQALLAKLREPANYTIAADEGEWLDAGLPGVRMRILALDRHRGVVTMIISARPGARYPAHHHSGPEECYVIRGSVTIGGRVLRAGDFHHAEGDTEHGEISTEEGVEVLLVASAADYLPN